MYQAVDSSGVTDVRAGDLGDEPSQRGDWSRTWSGRQVEAARAGIVNSKRLSRYQLGWTSSVRWQRPR